MPTYFNPKTTKVTVPFGKGTLEPGETVQTTYWLEDAELTALGITKTSSTPFAKIALSHSQLVFGGGSGSGSGSAYGSGNGAFTGLIDTKILRLYTTVSVTVYANSLSNPYSYLLLAGTSIDIYNAHEIERLIVVVVGSGSTGVVYLTEIEK